MLAPIIAFISVRQFEGVVIGELIFKSEHAFLLFPVQGNIDLPDQHLCGEMSRLFSSYDGFDYIRSQKRQRH